MSTTPSQRRSDIDWLRIFAILVVFLFHCNRFFDLGGWHIKNSKQYVVSEVISLFLGHWMMPLIFVISGASLVYGLRPEKLGKYFVDKVKRLAVPLVFGIFTMIPIQVYLERLTQREFLGSLFNFWPHYFEGWYGFGGNFAWMGLHLWYLLVLFVFSVLFLPLFVFLKKPQGKVFNARLNAFLSKPGRIYLLALPVVLLLATLDPNGIGRKDFGGWSVLIYPFFFIYGFILFSGEPAQNALVRQRQISLGFGILLTIILIGIYASFSIPDGSSLYKLVMIILGFSSWFWISAILGFGLKYLTFQAPLLPYANEAVLPFYILHQTVILIVGFFVVQWQTPALIKYFIIAPVSFAAILMIYEYLVRRINLLRVLFGMKPGTTSSIRSAVPAREA